MKKIKLLNIMVFAVWIVLLSFLLYRSHTGSPLGRAEVAAGQLDKKTQWYDIYAGREKIGFASTTYEQVGDEIITRHERQVKIRKNGNEGILVEKLKCLSDLQYAITSFEYVSQIAGEEGTKVTGKASKDDILFFIEGAERRKVFRVPVKEGRFSLPITVIPWLVQQKPAVGSTFVVPMLDLSNFSILDARVELKEIRPLKVGIDVSGLYQFDTGGATIWSNEKGVIVKQEDRSGISLYSQTESLAKEVRKRVLFDYTSLPYVRSNQVIQYPEQLRTLRVKVKRFAPDPRLYDNTFITLQDNVLSIVKADEEEMKKGSYGLPYEAGTMSKYLQPDAWVLSDHETVKGNAHNMAVVEKQDAFRMARYLTSNLYFTVGKMPMFSLQDSLDIFKSHVGDYLERSVMFASFARAAGMPARIIGGLVYKNGNFFFHTWPEAWLGKWVPLDPTLAQFPADVTHIPLREGTQEEIIAMINDLRFIEVEILEAR